MLKISCPKCSSSRFVVNTHGKYEINLDTNMASIREMAIDTEPHLLCCDCFKIYKVVDPEILLDLKEMFDDLLGLDYDGTLPSPVKRPPSNVLPLKKRKK